MTATIKDGAGSDLLVETPTEVKDALVAALGATNSSAASTASATSGLNGLLRYFFGRFELFRGQIPTALGQTTMTGSMSVTLASNDSYSANFGAKADAAATTDSDTTVSFFGWFKYLLARMTTLIGHASNAATYLLNISTDTSNLPVYAAPEEYETFSASATNQKLGATGVVGDRISLLVIQPGTLTPGSLVLKDGSTTIYTFPGGSGSVSNLAPILVPLNIRSLNTGGFSVTTGADVSGIATGDFT